MRNFLIGLMAAASLFSPLAAQEAPKALTPNDIVAAAPASDWVRIAPSDLLVMNLAPDAEAPLARSGPRRVVIQLMPPPFSQGWVGNIRRLVAGRWYDGVAVVRVQDNYVVQWGDPDGEIPAKAKPLPKGLYRMDEAEYLASVASLHGTELKRQLSDLQSISGMSARMGGNTLDPPKLRNRDPYALVNGFEAGWPVASDGEKVWPIHCYGMVGVGRDLSPDTGTGAELYAVIGQAPRQLDRNIALVGRVIAGMENLSSLPRGTGELGFYKTPEERTRILSVRMGNDVTDLPVYEYLSPESASFAAYADKRANRKDAFYIRAAGGVDICNVPVPVRAVAR